MYSKKSTLFTFLFLVSSFLFLVSSRSHAQEMQRSITISPPSIDRVLRPGDTAEGTMKVINDGNDPLTIEASMQDFIVEDTKGTPVLLAPNKLSSKYSGATWIGIYPSTFTLAPHSRQELTYYMQIPRDARPGGHYAAIVYNPTSTIGVAGTGASVNTLIGTLFYISVEGPIVEKANVSKFFANIFQEYGPVDITTQIRNMGDLHFAPIASISVYNTFGKKIEVQPLSEENIFPEQARDYKNTVGKKWMIGRYSAKLMGSHGKANNLPLTATLVFWVFPWRLAVIIILVIVTIILGTKLYKKRKEHGQTPPPADSNTNLG